MATVDWEKVKQLILDSAHTPCSASGTACQARRVLPALIRRVERYERALDTIADEHKWFRRTSDDIRKLAREALKEEPDSASATRISETDPILALPIKG